MIRIITKLCEVITNSETDEETVIDRIGIASVTIPLDKLTSDGIKARLHYQLEGLIENAVQMNLPKVEEPSTLPALIQMLQTFSETMDFNYEVTKVLRPDGSFTFQVTVFPFPEGV